MTHSTLFYYFLCSTREFCLAIYLCPFHNNKVKEDLERESPAREEALCSPLWFVLWRSADISSARSTRFLLIPVNMTTKTAKKHSIARFVLSHGSARLIVWKSIMNWMCVNGNIISWSRTASESRRMKAFGQESMFSSTGEPHLLLD